MQLNPAIRSCPRNAMSYEWKAGDTVLSVAASQGITPGVLAQANPDVDLSALQPGVLICVPLGPLSGSGDGPVLDGTGSDTGVVTPSQPGGPVLDGTGSDTGVVTPSRPGGPVLDGTGSDAGVVTPQPLPQRPAVRFCPIGYSAYTVKPGQTYADLLVDLNVSYSALRASNPALDPARLTAGVSFCAPPAGTRLLCSRASASYTIQPGETLASLAEKFGVSQGRLLLLNPTLVPTDFSSGTIICRP